MRSKRVYTEEQKARKQALSRAWHTANKSRTAAQRKETAKRWKQENPARVLYNGMVASSKKRGHDIEVSFTQIEKLLAPMTCALTGRQLTFGAGDWAPSIDRIDSSLGYIPGNVRLTAWCVNRALGEHGEAILLEIARALVAKQGM